METFEQILEIARQIEPLGYSFAFLGGSVLHLLVTDPAAMPIRVTKDVDVLVDAPTRRSYTDLEAKLRAIGFRNDTRENAPICRYVFNGVVVDVMPTTENVLGWASPWLAEALASSETRLFDGSPIRILTPPYFLATKIEAFQGRGHGDFLASQDMEDIICLVNGRSEIVAEVVGSRRPLRQFISRNIQSWMNSRDFRDAIDGFLVTENEPLARAQLIQRRFLQMA